MIKSVFLMFSLICIVQGVPLKRGSDSKEEIVPDDQGMRDSQMFAVSGEGVITSHESYPEGEYPNNVNWTKYLEVAPGKAIEFTFVEDFEIEGLLGYCLYDWVEIVDGDGRDLVKRTCGTSKPDTVTSTTNKVSVEFKTDFAEGGKGFKLKWREVDPFNCVCGVPNRASKIVGGVTTEKNEYPWQVGLSYFSSDSPSCGGSIISDKTILTAAHCTDGVSPRDITVVVGDHDWSVADGEQRFAVCNITQHPKYKNPTIHDYDLSLLILCSPLTFKREVQPVCLPARSGCIYEYRSATVSGWGRTKQNGEQSEQLMKVNVTTITNLECKEDFNYNSAQITDNMICALQVNKDSCQGDSGGPLIANEPGFDHSVLIGVVSWGIGCADKNFPGVYSRVTAEKEFIMQFMSGKICPVPAGSN